jgi:hypothetical protein
MARERWEKISDDIEKLRKARFDTKKLETLLKDAKKSITEGTQKNEEAESLLFKKFILPALLQSQETDEATSTPETAITPAISTSTEIVTTSTPHMSTSTATTTEVSEPEESPPSITDLARTSLLKIREAYQIFIEMSNLVRKLLG